VLVDGELWHLVASESAAMSMGSRMGPAEVMPTLSHDRSSVLGGKLSPMSTGSVVANSTSCRPMDGPKGRSESLFAAGSRAKGYVIEGS